MHRMQVIDGGSDGGPLAGLEGAEGWIVLTGPVPRHWRDRAVSLHLIPLLPQETSRIVAGGTALPGVSLEDEPLLRVIAKGQKTSAMARELRMPQWTLERKLERLRRLLDVPSTSDLVALLARLGFAHADGALGGPPGPGGTDAAGQERSPGHRTPRP